MIIFFQLFISLLFFISAFGKLKILKNFVHTIESLGFSKKLAKIGSIFVISLEFLISVLILFEKTRLFAEIILFATLLIFSWSVWKSTKIKKSVKCNCFGDILEENLGKKTYIRILVFLILNFILFGYTKESSILNSNLTDVILQLFISIGILLMYVLLTTFYRVSLIFKGGK